MCFKNARRLGISQREGPTAPIKLRQCIANLGKTNNESPPVFTDALDYPSYLLTAEAISLYRAFYRTKE